MTRRSWASTCQFDVAMLTAVVPDLDWPWHRSHDLLRASHLLASNKKKDLTSLCKTWLDYDLQPWEDALETAVKQCRRLCQSKRTVQRHIASKGERCLFEVADPITTWRIAEQGLSEMPGTKQECWRADGWWPRAMARYFRNEGRKDVDENTLHLWETVNREYANQDSAATLALWPVMKAEIERRKLWNIYRSVSELHPVASAMERRGVSTDGEQLEKLSEHLLTSSLSHGERCVAIAASYGHPLDLPKGASPNASLRTFMLDVMHLPPISGTKAKTNAPSLDKGVMAHYAATLPERSRELLFVNTLLKKRELDTALSFLDSYRQFWLVDPLHEGWYRLHPQINLTGTDTLRVSMQNPNAQQIKGGDIEDIAEDYEEGDTSLRSCFGPVSGREWFSMDYQNIELRIPFYVSGEKELIDLFEHPDDPPYYGSNHLLNFHTIYEDVWEQELREVGFEKVGPHVKKKYKHTMYTDAKSFGFGLQYQAGEATSDRTAKRRGSYRKVKQRFKNLDNLNLEKVAFAEKHGYVETLPDKTVDPLRGYPLLCTRTDRGGILPTVPLSYFVQGTACWCAHKALMRCQKVLDRWNSEHGTDNFITLYIHDEIVFDLKMVAGLDNLPLVRQLRNAMEESGRDVGVPLTVNVEHHTKHWGKGSKVTFEDKMEVLCA